MKIICAGVSKTGTKTMTVALRLLGYNVYDTMENFENYGDVYFKLLEKGWSEREFRQMYEDIDVVIGGPAYYFWEEILNAFPDAKVILAVRDNEHTWYRSMRNQVTILYEHAFWFYNLTSPTWRKLWKFSTDLILLPFGVRRRKPFDVNVFLSESVWKQAYRRHNAHVLHVCPKDQLLVYKCHDGWDTLCKFLGKPIPTITFPHKNADGSYSIDMWENRTFQEISKEARNSSCFVLGFIALVVITGLYDSSP